MKNKYIPFLCFLLLVFSTLSAHALSFSFSDKDFLGGASWGTMTISAFNSSTLEVRYDASASIPAGSQVTGFGFTFNPLTIGLASVGNPDNGYTAGDRDDLNWVKLTNLNAIPQPANRDEFTPIIDKSNYKYGVTEGNANNFSSPGIVTGQFDLFYLILNGVDLTKVVLDDVVALTGIRLQSLPSNINGGSLFLAGKSPTTPVPEPGSLILLGIGLVGLAGYCRRILKTS